MNTSFLPIFSLDLARVLAVTVFLYVLPGLGFTAWLSRFRPLAWSEQLALAPAISLALYPLLFLWAYTLGLKPGAGLTWALPVLGGALFYWYNRQAWANLVRFPNPRGLILHKDNVPSMFLLLLIGLLFVSRFLPIRLLTEPFWGDSVHHTIITQLIVDNGGLFQSWEPYAPIRSLTYHFGFHVAAAQWVWLTGVPVSEAVLIVGQVFNVLAVLALYPLALCLTDHNHWAGIGAVMVAGFLLTMPAYYVNWGRYTQLTGQVILPALIWLFVMTWSEIRPNRILWYATVLLAAGLALTHYRVAVLAATAGVAWMLWGMWILRHRSEDLRGRLLWISSAGVGAGGLILPWIFVIRGGAMQDLFVRVARRPASNPALAQDLALWMKDVPRFYPTLFWVGALLLLLVALWKKRPLAVPLILWAVFTFRATNPYLLHLPGTGWVSNFLVIIAVYIPLALLWGWAGGEVMGWMWDKSAIGPWLAIPILAGLLGWGIVQQVRVVDFFYRMVWPSDRVAFQWIDENTPTNSRFLINGFSVYSGVLVVGSDGGWWLPYFTRRTATIPPASYFTEANAEPDFITRVDKVEEDVRASNGDPTLLHAVLCRDNITHVYLGERRGEVGFSALPLVQEQWLAQDPAFSRLFSNGLAQVWSFDRNVCPGE